MDLEYSYKFEDTNYFSTMNSSATVLVNFMNYSPLITSIYGYFHCYCMFFQIISKYFYSVITPSFLILELQHII